MNIFRQFQNAIIARLNWDAYFSQSEAIELKAEKRPTTRKDVQSALADRGIIGIVSLPKFERAGDGEFEYVCDLEFWENPKLTESDTAERDGLNCVAKAMALLFHYVIPITNIDGERSDPFRKLEMDEGGFVEERDGIPVYRVRISTRIYIDVLVYILGNEDEFALVNENGEALIQTPTAP